MNRLVPVVVAILAGTVPCFAESPANEPASPEEKFDFEAEMARLRSGDTSVDFTRLRFELAESGAFSPFATAERGLRSELVAAVNADQCEKALTIADKMLEINFFYPDAHTGAMICDDALGNSSQAAFHRAVLKSLFESICAPEAGLEDSHPCKVIAIYEEYFVLQTLGLQFRGQSMHSCAGAPCDRMTAVDPETGDEITLYFDITIANEAMQR
jgi:hypothetical protein